MTDYDKKVKLEIAYDIIGDLDESAAQTKWLDEAIKQLKLLKYKRENIPQ